MSEVLTTQKTLFPDEQSDLDSRLVHAAANGDMQTVQTLLAAGADVHAKDDYALHYAAYHGHAETVQVLLASGADVHAQNDWSLWWATLNGHTETVQVLAKHIFAPESWRGKNRAEIEAEATALYDKINASDINPEYLRKAGTILLDSALTCWEQVRPPPPPIQISPLPAQPRPL